MAATKVCWSEWEASQGRTDGLCQLGETGPGPPLGWGGHPGSGTKPALSGGSSMSHHSSKVAGRGGSTAGDLGDPGRGSGGH